MSKLHIKVILMVLDTVNLLADDVSVIYGHLPSKCFHSKVSLKGECHLHKQRVSKVWQFNTVS